MSARMIARPWIRAWDLLTGIALGIPLLLGGIAWNGRLHPGELAPGVAIAVLGALLLRARSGDWGWIAESALLRALSGAWRRTSDGAERRPVRAALAGTLLFAALWALVSLRRHWEFESNGFDLGIFTNTLANFTAGRGYVSSLKGGINLFADHQSPILLAFAPAFALVPRAETLLVLQALGLAAGAPALWVLARRRGLPPAVAALAALAYWTYLPVRNAAFFDFHPETMMLPLFLWAVAGLESSGARTRAAGALAFALALACKETAGPVAVGLGLAWALQSRRRLALGAVTAGLLVFAFDLLVVPRLFEAEYAYAGLYGGGEGLASRLADPLGLAARAFGPARLEFLLRTLLPLGFLPLLAPKVAVAALPGYAMLFLMADDHRVSVDYHYGIEPGVGLLLAVPAGLARARALIAARARRPGGPILAPLLLLGAMLALLGHGRPDVQRIRAHAPTAERIALRDEILPCLAPEASFAATDTLLAHLAVRPWVHHLARLRDGAGEPVACVAVAEFLRDWPWTAEQSQAALSKLRGSSEYFRIPTPLAGVWVFHHYTVPARDCWRCGAP